MVLFFLSDLRKAYKTSRFEGTPPLWSRLQSETLNQQCRQRTARGFTLQVDVVCMFLTNELKQRPKER